MNEKPFFLEEQQKRNDRLGRLNYEATVKSFVSSGLVETKQIVPWNGLEEAVRKGHREGAEMVKQEVLREMAREMTKLETLRQIEKES